MSKPQAMDKWDGTNGVSESTEIGRLVYLEVKLGEGEQIGTSLPKALNAILKTMAVCYRLVTYKARHYVGYRKRFISYRKKEMHFTNIYYMYGNIGICHLHIYICGHTCPKLFH